MDGLAFYRLTQVPRKETRKRKVDPKVEEVEESGVEYRCANCSSINLVSSKSTIQCTRCDWRILEKGRKTQVVLKAV
jgi:DNA-directed RNA polymerase subunit RPC12/RpoP